MTTQAPDDPAARRKRSDRMKHTTHTTQHDARRRATLRTFTLNTRRILATYAPWQSTARPSQPLLTAACSCARVGDNLRVNSLPTVTRRTGGAEALIRGGQDALPPTLEQGVVVVFPPTANTGVGGVERWTVQDILHAQRRKGSLH